MRYKFQDNKVWVSPDKREWVQCAYSPPEEEMPDLEFKEIELCLSNGILNAIGQVVYFQQESVQDGAHFVVSDNGDVVQHQSPLQQVKHHSMPHAVRIQIINPGPLHKDHVGQWRTWWGDLVTTDWIREEDGVGWVCANGDQIHSVIELCNALQTEYGDKTVIKLAEDCKVLDPMVYDILDRMQFAQ